ncbi:MFS transporter [Orrella marina]|uniref:MFS transporter n=1 Tax=Orrella marina TaxID=2163011 RepID=A0A2R4XPG8_9BURK|nr:MFS transporter [Orrella marina]AWB35713.1 MFS transporter [Orrella marina]
MAIVDLDAQPHRLDRGAIFAIMLGVIIVTLDISLTSTAIPAIASGLGVSPASTIWIINTYYLAVVSALLPLAALGEIFGHRKVFMLGLVVFAAGSVLAGTSGSLAGLTAARGLVGLGAAAVSATTPALIKCVYPPNKLGRGLGLYAMVVGVAFTAGPTTTSAVLSVADWPWLFFLNVPVALVALLMATMGLPDTERNVRRFDKVAASICALMFAALLTVISNAGHLRWSVALTALGLTVVLAYFLRKREAGVTAPVLALDLFRIRIFALSSITAICSFAVQGLVFVALPMLFMFKLGYSQVEAGLLITPWPATLALMTLVAAPLSERIAPGMLGGIGMLIVSIGLGLISTMPESAGIFDIAWRLILCGIGFGLFQSPNMVALMSSAPRERSGSAGGILATSRLLGQSIGAAAVAFCLSIRPVDGIETALWLGALAGLFAGGVSFSRLTRFARRA